MQRKRKKQPGGPPSWEKLNYDNAENYEPYRIHFVYSEKKGEREAFELMLKASHAIFETE